jgi:hypothetical protein
MPYRCLQPAWRLLLGRYQHGCSPGAVVCRGAARSAMLPLFLWTSVAVLLPISLLLATPSLELPCRRRAELGSVFMRSWWLSNRNTSSASRQVAGQTWWHLPMTHLARTAGCYPPLQLDQITIPLGPRLGEKVRGPVLHALPHQCPSQAQKLTSACLALCPRCWRCTQCQRPSGDAH